MDDLFGFGEPASAAQAPAPQFLSRRELREAEARARGGAVAPQTPAVAAPLVVPAAPPAVVPAAPQETISLGHIRSAPFVPAAAPAVSPVSPVSPVSVEQPRRPRAAAPVSRPPRSAVRVEKAIARASRPRPARKNPFSVLATMGVVGGLFAVAGLPAYAISGPDETTAAVSDAGAQSIAVSAEVAATVTVRDGYRATTPDQLAQQNKDALRAAANAAYLASGAREMGDDYPWPYELTDDQGGGLSPLNYYYRECVDFVAWRLNRDAGYYAAPYKWVWSNLTPLGGNGGQWMYNWQAKGWPVSKTPVVGAVAYTGGNHIAYVKAVNSDGTVLLEEYNYIPGMYGQRTLPASSVVAFLYPPPE